MTGLGKREIFNEDDQIFGTGYTAFGEYDNGKLQGHGLKIDDYDYDKDDEDEHGEFKNHHLVGPSEFIEAKGGAKAYRRWAEYELKYAQDHAYEKMMEPYYEIRNQVIKTCKLDAWDENVKIGENKENSL